MGWRDLTITPLIEIFILSVSLLSVSLINRFHPLSFPSKGILFYLAVVLYSLIALKIIRSLFPFRSGMYNYRRHPLTCYVWNLYGFIYETNLNLLYILVPVTLKKLFYKLDRKSVV